MLGRVGSRGNQLQQASELSVYDDAVITYERAIMQSTHQIWHTAYQLRERAVPMMHGWRFRSMDYSPQIRGHY